MAGRNYGGRRGPILTYPCTNCIVLCQRLLKCSNFKVFKVRFVKK